MCAERANMDADILYIDAQILYIDAEYSNICVIIANICAYFTMPCAYPHIMDAYPGGICAYPAIKNTPPAPHRRGCNYFDLQIYSKNLTKGIITICKETKNKEQVIDLTKGIIVNAKCRLSHHRS